MLFRASINVENQKTHAFIVYSLCLKKYFMIYRESEFTINHKYLIRPRTKAALLEKAFSINCPINLTSAIFVEKSLGRPPNQKAGFFILVALKNTSRND